MKRNTFHLQQMRGGGLSLTVLTRLSFLRSCTRLTLILAMATLHNTDLAAQITFSPELYGPYQYIPGTYYVRTYLVYEDPNETGWYNALGDAELFRRARRSLDLLNNAYNQYGIYFILDSQIPFGCFDKTQHAQTRSNCLNIIVGTDNTNLNGVAENPVPCKVVYVSGMEDGVPASNLPVLIHEVGHAFGLAHPFDNSSCNELTETCDNPGPGQSPCDCCGDFVCDTDYSTVEQITLSSDCFSSVDPPGMPEHLVTNYMGYATPSRCRHTFTPGQAARMRKYFATPQTPLQDILITPEIIPSNTSETISTPTEKTATIEVQSGATLVVNADVTMAEGTYIVVRRGGVLEVNATLSANCYLWGGVVVEGTNNEPQSETSSGKVVLGSNGVIEHAKTGIGAQGFSNGDNDEDDFSGGIIESHGIIRDCVSGMYFARYDDPNASSINVGRFYLTDDYRGESGVQPVMLRIDHNEGINIAPGFFIDQRTEGCQSRADRAIGIEAYDAGFSVLGGSNFQNLDVGIYADNIDMQTGSLAIRNSEFSDCYTAIHVNDSEDFSITGNNIKVRRPDMCPVSTTSVAASGVIIEGYASSFVFSGNTFLGDPNTEEEMYVGSWCQGTGNSENRISHNSYQNLDYGNLAEGNNGYGTGLLYKCNTNSDNKAADFYIANNGSVRAVQGEFIIQSEEFAAVGNTFTTPTSVNSLPRTILDSLGYWGLMCTQPGFLCKALLRRNGVDVATDCGAGITDRALREKPSKRAANKKASLSWTIYPNPAGDHVRIVADEYPLQIRLTDAFGRIVIPECMFEADVTFDVSMLPPGYYWLSATSAQGVYGHRSLIISH